MTYVAVCSAHLHELQERIYAPYHVTRLVAGQRPAARLAFDTAQAQFQADPTQRPGRQPGPAAKLSDDGRREDG